MAFCPEHGPEMKCLASTSGYAVYECQEGEKWVYLMDVGAYQPIENFPDIEEELAQAKPRS